MDGAASRVQRGRPKGFAIDATALRERRLSLGFTQEELADRSGVTTRTAQSAEAGARVALSTAKLLADALDVPLDELHQLTPGEVRRLLREAGFAPPPPPRRGAAPPRILATLRSDRGARCALLDASPAAAAELASLVVSSLAPDFPDGIAWVRAAPEIRAGDVCDRLAGALRLGTPPFAGPDGGQAFRRRFWRERRLLVLEGLTSMEMLQVLAGDPPEGPRWVLVTTTSAALASDVEGSRFTLPR